MAAQVLMFQGTGSDVGKSLIVAGLARLLHGRGMKVRPFKPQNMSNNAAVTVDGGEIGRAQALQAKAAGVPPSIDMNPVLLKPQGGCEAQVVVQGRMAGTATARDYQWRKQTLLPVVLASFERLRAEADIVLVEGAGSASEINLRQHDIANMGFACAAAVPVVIIGDIDRGGVIAGLVGTHAVLSEEDRRSVGGFIVNKMRGDPSLFADGMCEIARRTGWRDCGLVPYFDEARILPAEDSLALGAAPRVPTGKVRVAVPMLPWIANFDDLDPLISEPDVELVWVPRGRPIPAPCDLVILPGSKAPIADLAILRQEGWDVDLRAHWRRGGRILGLCGGYQMLGARISDPLGIEGTPSAVAGLGFLDCDTVLGETKALRPVHGATMADNCPFEGYEMHVGTTTPRGAARPMIRFDDGSTDGAVSADGLISGTYVHGFFHHDRQRAAWIARLGGTAAHADFDGMIETTLDRLAAHLERFLNVEGLLSLAR